MYVSILSKGIWYIIITNSRIEGCPLTMVFKVSCVQKKRSAFLFFLMCNSFLTVYDDFSTESIHPIRKPMVAFERT